MTQHPLNQSSWALIIGIDRYKGNSLPPLETAERGARALAETLHKDLNFPRNQIVTLINQEATRDAIQSMLTDYFTDSRVISEDARLLVYYAGHGLTRNPQNGKDKVGYLAPYDAEIGRWSTFIEMDLLERQAGFMPARHVLYLLDACFAGFALTRSPMMRIDPIQDMLNRPSRLVITASNSDQLTTDRLGQEVYSSFTYFLLDGLRGAAMRDGILRAGHLGIYLQDQVRKQSLGRQTPQIGRMLGDEGGDFVFRIETHAQLDVWLQQALTSASPQERLKAAYELWETIEKNEDSELVQMSIRVLESLQYDHDSFVREAVRQALRQIQLPTAPSDGIADDHAEFLDDEPTAVIEVPKKSFEKTTQTNISAAVQSEAPTRASRPTAPTLPFSREEFQERLAQLGLHEAPTLPRRPSST